MYVLARHEGESILMLKGPDGYLVEIKVLQVTGKIARLGIEAPKEVEIVRAEIYEEESYRGDQGHDKD